MTQMTTRTTDLDRMTAAERTTDDGKHRLAAIAAIDDDADRGGSLLRYEDHYTAECSSLFGRADYPSGFDARLDGGAVVSFTKTHSDIDRDGEGAVHYASTDGTARIMVFND